MHDWQEIKEAMIKEMFTFKLHFKKYKGNFKKEIFVKSCQFKRTILMNNLYSYHVFSWTIYRKQKLCTHHSVWHMDLTFLSLRHWCLPFSDLGLQMHAHAKLPETTVKYNDKSSTESHGQKFSQSSITIQ